MRARAFAALALLCLLACRRGGAAADPDAERETIRGLIEERERLRGRIDTLAPKDKRLAGLPAGNVRFGVPTSLARELVQRTASGFVDQVTLVLRDLKVHKEDSIKKVVTLGVFSLDVNVDEVRGLLKTGPPRVDFGKDRIAIALPVSIASGTARATIHFKWDGKSVGGMVCGDLDVTQAVSGRVKPATYPVSGTLLLSSSETQILATPRFPTLTVKLEVEPSAESWAAVQKILDEKKGVCGFVLENVDVRRKVEEIVGRGFSVRLPTEKIKPVGLPVGLSPTVSVRDKTVALTVSAARLAVTERMLWLGAQVTVSR